MSTTIPMKEAEDNQFDENLDTLNNDDMLVMKITQRRELPTGIASNVKQHVILARDHSTSMSGNKITELNLASESLVTELANTKNKDGFRVSVVDFNDRSDLVHFGQSAEKLNLQSVNASGGTNFFLALSKTLEAVQDFKSQPNDEGWHYLRPVVLFLSDGQASSDDSLIQQLQEEADVITIAYGSDADTTTLSRIASDGKVQVIGTDGNALRDFLSEVGKTLSDGVQKAH